MFRDRRRRVLRRKKIGCEKETEAGVEKPEENKKRKNSSDREDKREIELYRVDL